LSSSDAWKSQVRFPFIQVGTPGVYNLTPDHGLIGAEVRPIPQDDIFALRIALEAYYASQDLELRISVMENGVVCDPENPYLIHLIQSVEKVSNTKPVLGKKLPGTSARFAPGGQGIVWGQSGIGPHTANECHYIPSIEPYYNVLTEFSTRLVLP
jgi:acetylornithine deacetylase/succinyl-diaminopimelate desuccinylase-like protein